MEKNYAVLMECKPTGLGAQVDLTAVEAMETMEEWSKGEREWKRIYILDTSTMTTISELTEEMMEEK